MRGRPLAPHYTAAHRTAPQRTAPQHTAPLPTSAPCRPPAPPRYTAKDDLCYVLLELGPGASRQQLEQLQPDVAAMHAAASAEHVHGVIVCLTVPGASEAAAAGGDESSAGELARLPAQCPLSCCCV